MEMSTLAAGSAGGAGAVPVTPPTMVAVLESDFVVSTMLVAVTVTVAGEGIAEGAV